MMRSACEPLSITLPSPSTKISLESMMVERRWAINRDVLPLITLFMEFRMFCSNKIRGHLRFSEQWDDRVRVLWGNSGTIG